MSEQFPWERIHKGDRIPSIIAIQQEMEGVFIPCEKVDIFGNICTRPAIHDGRHVSRAMRGTMHIAKSVW